MKIKTFLRSVLAAGLFVSGAFAVHALEVPSARGVVKFEEPAGERIAVFDMAAMDTLEALGVLPKGVVSNILVDYLQDAKQADAVEIGTLFEPSMEALNRMKPEVIVIGARVAPKHDALARIAPVLDVTNTGVSVDNANKLLESLGKLTAKEELAAELQQNLAKELALTKEIVKDQGKALMVMVNGSKLASFGVNSRFGYLFNDFGWEAADKTQSTARHGQPISFEFIRRVDPDWLIVMDRTSAVQSKGDNAKTVLSNALLRDTKAFREDRIIYLDSSSYLASGGYQQMMLELKLLRDAVARVEGK